MFGKTLLLLLVVAFLPLVTPLRAEEEIKITQGGEPRGPDDFCIRVSGELKSYTGYLHGSAPFTLRQAIDAAGGLSEWAGEILIYSPTPSADAPEKLEKRIKINLYLHDAEQQNLLLTSGWHVHLAKAFIGRFK